MNPIFGGHAPIMNPMHKLNQVMHDVRMLQQNPGQLGQYLSDHGMVNKSQINDINKFNGNFAQAGQYLMQNGVMSKNQVNQMAHIVPTVQQNIK